MSVFKENASSSGALMLTLVLYMTNFLGCLLGVVLIERLGRKALYVSGLAITFVSIIFVALLR
jgi:MFS family permease